MVKTKLKTEQLVAGALLSFESVSSTDISLLVEDFLKKNTGYDLQSLGFDSLGDFITYEDGKISLKQGLTLDSYVPQNNSTLRKRFEQIAGRRIREYFAGFDMEEYLLRKVEHFSSIPKENNSKEFCKTQQEQLKKLEEDGYLITAWQKEAIYDDYPVLKLTDRGRVRLFRADNEKEINSFLEIMRAMRYDTSLLDDFLLKQDLDLPPWSVLDLIKLDEFCKEYDRAITEEGASTLQFSRLGSDKKTILDEEGKKSMEDMLAVWDNHSIHICHPNHIFAGAKPITADVREMANINWDDIDVAKMIRINDFQTFVSPDCSKAFRYVHERLGHQIMGEVKKGNKDGAVSYLVVLEQYPFDHDNYYLVRGIIRGDYEGYSLAFNPEYQATIPKSVWERSLRMGDHEIPAAYLVKRKK